MLTSVLLSLVLALGAAAAPSVSHVRRAVDGVVSNHLVERQGFTSDILPQQCQSSCTGALQIYNACASNDQTTCLTVCNSDTFNDFVGCFKCVVENTADFPVSSLSTLQATINQLEKSCAATGTTPSVTVSLAAVSGSSASAVVSATDAESLITVPGTSPSSTSGVASASGVIASASSAAGALASGASSAGAVASSAAASVVPSGAAQHNIVATWALGAVGVAAGVLAF